MHVRDTQSNELLSILSNYIWRSAIEASIARAEERRVRHPAVLSANRQQKLRQKTTTVAGHFTFGHCERGYLSKSWLLSHNRCCSDTLLRV
ncbi:hypothetical protein Ahia01_000925600 [Argonauta hians]